MKRVRIVDRQGKKKDGRRPPKAFQFKPGQSGNPKGRPKGRQTPKALWRKILNQKITITVGGKPTRVPYLEALVMQTARGALKGDIQQTKLVFGVAQDLEYEDRTVKKRELREGASVKEAMNDYMERIKDMNEARELELERDRKIEKKRNTRFMF